MTGNAFRKGTLLILTGPVPHFHIVMNDPVFSGEHGKNCVLVVNISSVKPNIYHDPTCVLDVGCHDFVKRPSWVVYEGATVMDVARIDSQILTRDISTDDPVTEAVFAQVRMGFDGSPQVKPKIRRFLRIHEI
ncbi:hypothetical protein ALQ25_101756 [Pseudomonas coronafaciens pv. atropurpurea]|uniref:Uncharacterized protein n=1 Tax=Pseudomonas syringae pv. maculicola TaxID=59511 RepID=A0A3M6B822_PSEYM|nr:hypothetical protein ALQ25_101756 [Pseudomonas coronafaciens pv. atropurpurea]RMV27572.1 hypothetical protein ALP13_200085 [Pseudomonas syringae pv. maculicola]